MRLAYVGLSIAMALFIIAQAVSKPVFFYLLVIPGILFIYGIVAEETLPEMKEDDEEETPEENDD